MDFSPKETNRRRVDVTVENVGESRRLRRSLPWYVILPPLKLWNEYQELVDFEDFGLSETCTIELTRRQLGHVAGKALERYGGSAFAENRAFVGQIVEFFEQNPRITLGISGELEHGH